MDTLPDIFSKYSQGSAASKNSFKSKQKKCGKTIDDILGSAEPFEEKTEKKRKNKRTVDKFQEDAVKDFDWLSISNSHTLLSKEVHGSVESTNSFVTQIDDKKKEILGDFPKTVVELQMENLTPENPKYMEPKISERARSCHKDNTNDIVDKSCRQKLFFDEFNEEKVDKVIEADLKGTFKTNKLPKIDTFPDIFSRSSQGSAMTKNSLKIKKKKCRKTIDDILSSPEPFEEKTEKKRKNKKTVDKFQEDVKKDFDWLSISNSHTLLSKQVHGSVSESAIVVTQESDEKMKEIDDKKKEILDDFQNTVVELQVETQTPEDPKNTQPKISQRARSCLKDKTNDKVAKSSKHVQFTVVRKLFFDVLGFPEVIEEQIDEVVKEDMTGYNYQETVEALPEEVEELRSVSSEDDYTPFSEESEMSVQEDEEMLTRASLEEALERDAEINVSLQEIYDEVIEEQIDEVVEEQIDEVIEVDMTGYNYQETVEALPEEVEEQRSVSSEDNYTPFSEESEMSVQGDEEMFLRASLEDALEREAEMNVSLQEIHDEVLEEQIDEVIEEQIDEVIEEQIDEVIEVDMTGYNYQETVEALPEEVEEQRSVSSEDDYTPFSEESEISVQEDKEMFLRASLQEAETNVSLQEALDRVEEMDVSLQEALEREARTKASLEEALKKEKAQQEEILEQERKEKALEKTLREAEAEKDDLRSAIDFMKAQVADLMKSQMSHEKQKHTITAMTAELDESKKLIIELQKDLEASTLQHEKEMAEGETVNCAQMKLLKEHLIQQQEKSLEKDNEIQSLNVKLQTLQMTIEAKDKIVSTLREKVERSASDLKEEETKNSELKRDYEAILSQQQKDEEKQKHLIQENQKLISENKRLQNKLEGQLLQKEPQEDDEACSRLEEDIPVDKARFLTACKKIQMQKEELAEKTLALEKSLTAEKYLRSSLRKEKKRFDQMVFQNQTSAEPDTFLKNQLREASANSECLTYDMQTLRMDNADIRAKFSATEAEFDKLKSKYTSLSERYQEMMLEKNETISENQHTITKLQCKAQKLKSRFEGIINKERTKNSELQQKVDQISSALEKEKTMCEKQRVELMEASTKQMTTLEEKQKLSLALQKAQEKAFSFKEPLGVSSIQSRHNSNYEFMLKQQRISLDKSTAALNHLQKQNSDITSEHRELLKTHSTLKLKYDKLLYEQGNQSCVHYGMQLSANLTS